MRKIVCVLLALVLVLSFKLVMAVPAQAATLEVGPGKPYATITTAIGDAGTGDTILVYADTYDAEPAWPIDVDVADLTIRSVSGAASTIIDPGASGQGAIEISTTGVTFDGFTVKQGTQAYSASDLQEHTIWVHANYSTIKNNTIIGAGGNQACIYIGGGTVGEPHDGYAALFGYQVSTPLGQTIRNNTFRYAASGEGWGIFAYDLSDSLIRGNQFVGDAADVGSWGTDEGAPGTGIIIHKATAATGSPSPGGGYVDIRGNTAQYVKYTWLTFYSAYPYNDVAGKMYEQPEASTVDKVIVRHNTVSDCGTAVNFHRANKSDCYGTTKCADLTVGSNGVTIGPGNEFYNNGDGIRIDDPKEKPTGCIASVLDADNIAINNNEIYDNTLDTSSWWGTPQGYGVWNGTTTAVNAEDNWWGNDSGPAGVGPGTGDAVSDYVDYDPWRTVPPSPAAPGPVVGGTVYPVDKVSILMPWIGLALLLALAGAYVARLALRKLRG